MRPSHRSPSLPPSLLACVALACCLAGCTSHRQNVSFAERPWPRSRHYDAPGPPEDPWGPYIRAAAARFGVAEVWIRAVMHQESSGQQYQDGVPTTSPAGAMGLMQVMPDTYVAMRLRYGLGDDPYEPHDNIFAGTAYIREMYDQFGFPSFLAAYNAGPDQLEACLVMGAPLPQETVSYLSAVAPRLKPYAPVSGPLAAYAELAPDPPADDLNRRMLMGQALPVVARRETPVLPCMPPASDRSADALNRAVLMGGSGGTDPETAALNRRSLSRAAR